jgi:dTDP-4-amino-4,6-dideoxygalactose transaminase
MKLSLSQAQARLILAQLDNVERHAVERMKLVRIYDQGLRGVAGVRLPPFLDDGTSGYLVYPIQVEDRSAMLMHLMTVGRDLASYYYRNCAELPCFADYRRDCPQASAATEQIILLPTYPGYGEAEARRNVEAVRSFFH